MNTKEMFKMALIAAVVSVGGCGGGEAYKQGVEQARHDVGNIRQTNFATGSTPDTSVMNELADLEHLRATTGVNQTPYQPNTTEYSDYVKGYKEEFLKLSKE